jgi:hypothetical protein
MEELRAYARRGRPGSGAVVPRIRIDVSPKVEQGQFVTLRWRVSLADSARLRVVGPDGVATEDNIALVGERRLGFETLGRHTVTIIAPPPAPRVGRRRRPIQSQATVDVVMPKPSCRLEVNRSVTLGEPINLAWKVTDAEEVRLILGGERRAVDAVGRTTFNPKSVGSYSVAIEAHGQGGRSESAHSVRVFAPPVIISSRALSEAEPGDLALISYAITGARSTWLQALDRKEEAKPIPVAGRIEVPSTLEPERLQFVAEGYDGRRATKTVTVQPKLFELPAIDEELALLNGEFL